MSGFRLILRAPLEARADLSAITPANLAGLDAGEAGGLLVPYGADRVALGDLFEVRSETTDALLIAGDPRLDFVGARLDAGEILVEGPVGAFAGAGMTGGCLRITGDAGEALAAGLEGGSIEVSGSVGARLGCARSGERAGMRGGMVQVFGDAGPHACERLRGGIVLVAGDVGANAAFDLVAGTLAVAGRLGPGAGRGMRRGTLILAQEPEAPAPGFVDNGAHDLVMLALLSRRVPQLAALFGGTLSGHVTRRVGDLLSGGRGEMLVLA